MTVPDNTNGPAAFAAGPQHVEKPQFVFVGGGVLRLAGFMPATRQGRDARAVAGRARPAFGAPHFR